MFNLIWILFTLIWESFVVRFRDPQKAPKSSPKSSKICPRKRTTNDSQINVNKIQIRLNIIPKSFTHSITQSPLSLSLTEN
jgi:hypothetical protein